MPFSNISVPSFQTHPASLSLFENPTNRIRRLPMAETKDYSTMQYGLTFFAISRPYMIKWRKSGIINNRLNINFTEII